MHDRQVTGVLATAAQHRTDLPVIAEAIHLDGAHGAQADSFARPRRRRFLTIARPCRVFMRARKPCLRERRRLFG